jgi:hypothetical protein
MTQAIISDINTKKLWSYWVDEAASAIDFSLDVSLQRYLVLVLQASVHDPGLIARYERFGFAWLESLQPNADPELIHTLGKDCLLMAGLFHGHTQADRLMSCCTIGVHAYQMLALKKEDASHVLYAQCVLHFKSMVRLVYWIRHEREGQLR